jgi:hypothetical protein
MRALSLASASIALFTAACGGHAAANVNTSSSSSGSGGASGSGGGGGAQGVSVTLTMDSFTVPAGAEIYNCQNFANPFGGMDTEVSAFESHMSAGSHHLLLFWQDATDNAMNYLPPGSPRGPLASCSGLEFAATPYGSQAEDDSLVFPPGVASLMPGANSFRIQSHYLNTSSETVTAHVEVTFHVATPGSVTNQAGVLFVVDPQIAVMPASSATVTDDCTMPQDMQMMRVYSHMHRHGTHFLATVAGSTVYETTTWSDPKPAVFAPPKSYKQGDPLHFECAFTNTGTTTLTFGESALTNEMCILTAAFYPILPGQPLIDASNCTQGQM